MRILLASTYFAPEHTGNAPYVTGLAHHLAARHDVTVVAGWPHYPHWQVDPEWRRWRSVERMGRLCVVRLAHYVPHRQDSARRAAYEACWAARLACEGRRHRADVVLAFVPTLLTAAVSASIARRLRVPLGVVVQDIVGRAAEQSGMSGGRSAARAAAVLERRGLHAAGRIATIHPRFADAIEHDYGVPRDRIDVIYNWSHIEQPRADRAVTRAGLGWGRDDVVVLHSGNMGLKQHLDNVVAAAALAEREGLPIRFVLAGSGNQRERIDRAAHGISTLVVRDAVDEAAFPDFLAAADVLLVNERAGVFEMSVPSKLTSYFAAGRPVVAATERTSATAELVGASGGGVVCAPDDPSALVRAVQGIAADRAGADAVGRSGRRFAEEKLSERAALAGYDEWVSRLCDERAG